MRRAELKAAAKEQIKGNIGMLLVIALITGLITCTVIGSILVPGLTLSLIAIYLNLTNGQKASVGDMFCRMGALGKGWWLSILTCFFTSLWSMLFVIPGIVKSFAYSMAPYVLAENPTMTAREALRVSKEITKGHKFEIFVLQLSFFWWHLLGMITFGLAYIYVVPYINATMANFYNSIKSAEAIVE